MKKKLNNLETGQILVILTVGILALLAFTALAVDGGMYLSDRRYDQNAADASAFAGAQAAGASMTAHNVTYSGFSCTDTDVQAAIDAAIASAKAQATDNNFDDLITGLSTQHGVEVTCGIDNNYPYPTKYLDVHVMITSYVQTAFAHLFFAGQFRNTVEAVTRVEPAEGVGKGMAIVALDEECGGNYGGLFLNGGGSEEPNITITGSGAHSNACIDCGGGSVLSSTGPLFYNKEPNGVQCPSGGMSPAPNDVDYHIDRYTVTVNCGGTAPAATVDGDTTTIYPGTYSSIIKTTDSKATLVMDPGLYCLEKGMDAKSSVVVDTHDNNNNGVTIYVIGGDLKINGGADVKLLAPRCPDEDTDCYDMGVPRAIPGMLIYMDPSNTGTIQLNGGSLTTIFRGTIYAPYGTVVINGTNNSDQWLTQVVADKITVGGDATVNITYDGDDLFTGDAFAELYK
jgi:hypothetical protein